MSRVQPAHLGEAGETGWPVPRAETSRRGTATATAASAYLGDPQSFHPLRENGSKWARAQVSWLRRVG